MIATDVILPHEEDPEYLSEMARASSADAARARLKLFRLSESLPLSEVCRNRADHLERLVAQDVRREAEMLRRLNAHMICTGTMPGGRRAIAGHVWMAVRADGLAVHLGAELPRDDVESDRDHEAQLRAEYAAAISYPGP